MKRLLFIMLILCLALPACRAAKPESTLEKVTLNLTYIPNVQFAPFYVAIEEGILPTMGWMSTWLTAMKPIWSRLWDRTTSSS